MKYSTINEFKEIDIEKLHSEINELILKRKYKQAITKLYACERFITKDKPISLRMYTKYLIILIFYKTKKFDNCIEAAMKSTNKCNEYNSVAEQYTLHIKYLWARSLYSKAEYSNIDD